MADVKPYAGKGRAPGDRGAFTSPRNSSRCTARAPDAPSMNRVKYALTPPNPEVSIIICTRDRTDLLAPCIDWMVDRSTYRQL